MATKSCSVCNRGNLSVGGYSNRVRATKFNPTGTRRAKVNLQWTTGTNGKRMKICTRCLKASKQSTVK